MKKKITFFSLLLLLSIQIRSQIIEKQDSITLLNDSIKKLSCTIDKTYRGNRVLQDSLNKKSQAEISNQIKPRKLFGSLFGESKQLTNADSLLRKLDNLPSFGMYKDNYIVTGTELLSRSNRWNSDAKFQVSIRFRLTNSVLPFKTHLFLTYTQKAFWDIYQESFPFRDLNFNPTIGIGRPLIQNNRLLGFIDMQFEHESNGKDADASRSWNKISFGSLLICRDRWILQSRLWIPFVDEENRDMIPYLGYGHIAMTYSSLKRKYNVSCMFTKRSGSFFNSNITVQFSVRLFANEDFYLFAEYYDGYGESLLDYKQYRQRIRAGINIKTNFVSIM